MASRWIEMTPYAGEEWRTVPGFADYMVSDHGRVCRKAGTWHTPFDRIVEGGVNQNGYRTVMLRAEGKGHSCKPHQLVADAFIRLRVPGDVVNHLDGNKQNNHRRNLEITDRAGNVAHAVKHGLIRRGARHGMAKLTDQDVRAIRSRFAAGEQGQTIADSYGIRRSYAYQIKNRTERQTA